MTKFAFVCACVALLLMAAQAWRESYEPGIKGTWKDLFLSALTFGLFYLAIMIGRAI